MMDYNAHGTSFNAVFIKSLKKFKDMVDAYPNFLPNDEKREDKLKEVWEALHPKNTEK